MEHCSISCRHVCRGRDHDRSFDVTSSTIQHHFDLSEVQRSTRATNSRRFFARWKFTFGVWGPWEVKRRHLHYTISYIWSCNHLSVSQASWTQRGWAQASSTATPPWGSCDSREAPAHRTNSSVTARVWRGGPEAQPLPTQTGPPPAGNRPGPVVLFLRGFLTSLILICHTHAVTRSELKQVSSKYYFYILVCYDICYSFTHTHT